MAWQTVEVTAPSTLKAGYMFNCEADGRLLRVTVPDGGVKEGQIFTGQATVVSDAEASLISAQATVVSDAEAPLVSALTTVVSRAYEPPRGAWKDNLWSCFAHGLCHPWCCASFWFWGCIGLAQLMERMNLTCCANPGTPQDPPAKPFTTILIIFVGYCHVFAFLHLWAMFHFLGAYCYNILYSIMGIHLLILGTKTRKFIRRKYEIPAGCCGEILEDFCCSLFCDCCSTAQMLRHTSDNNERADCCSSTGITSDPRIV